MPSSHPLCKSLTLLALLSAGSLLLTAQNASLSGTVRDSTGAVIPSVQLKATLVERNLVSKPRPTRKGGISFSILPVGAYAVEVSHEGFRTSRQTGVLLTVNERALLNGLPRTSTATYWFTGCELRKLLLLPLLSGMGGTNAYFRRGPALYPNRCHLGVGWTGFFPNDAYSVTRWSHVECPRHPTNTIFQKQTLFSPWSLMKNWHTYCSAISLLWDASFHGWANWAVPI